jgi:hypothetical protein
MGTKNLNSATDLITFTRASGGTALRKISYGNELVTNGTFDTDISGWNNDGTTSAIVGNQIEVTTVSGVSGSGVNQTITTVAGKRYKFSSDHAPQTGRARIEVKDNNVFGSGLGTLSQTSATGTYEFVFVALSNSTYIRLEAFDTSSVVLFDNVSVKEVLFDQADGTLQLWNHSNNEPRIEYDATGAVKGLLIEEARTNLIANSNTVPWFGSSVTTTLNAGVSPDGTSNASKMVPQVNLTNIYTYTSLQSMGSGVKSSTSIYLASAGYGFATVCAYDHGANRSTAVVDLSNGTITANYNVGIYTDTFTVEPAGNNFYRVSVTHENRSYLILGVSDTGTYTPGPNFGFNQAVATDGVSGLLSYGLQHEVGSTPSSYIPTSGSTVTRAADVATIPTSAFGYNQKVGSVLVEGKVIKANIGTTIDRRIVEISDGTTTNFIAVYQDVSVDQNLRIANQDAGVLSVNADTGYTLSDAQTFKVAIGIKLNNFAVSVDGGAVVTDTTGTVSNTLSQIDIGKLGGGTQYLNGYIKSIKYYPRRLTNTQLQELTT